MYALVDCNNFCASCERLFNPALNGRPVVVLSGNDGCVIARSNEAKALGIGMGQPAFELRDLFVREQVAIFSSNHILYGDISRRVMSVLSQFSPEVEVYSIDEAFLSLDGIDMPYGAEAYARTIADTVMRCVGYRQAIGSQTDRRGHINRLGFYAYVARTSAKALYHRRRAYVA